MSSKAYEMLLESIACHDLAGIKTSINRGAHINKLSKKGMTPLGFAAGAGRLQCLKLMVELGKDLLVPHHERDKSSLALNLDGQNSRKNIGYFVYSAETEEIDNDGPTPEGMDALEWDMEISEDEKENDQNKNQETDGQVYKYYADVLNNSPISIRSPENDIARLDKHGHSVLHYAVQAGSVQTVEFLLDTFKDLSINQCNTHWYTPLHMVSKSGNYNLAKLLVERGANVNAYTMRKQTPLFLAAQASRPDICRLLLTHRANPNVFDDEDKSPITMSVIKENEEILKMLIEFGARIPTPKYDLAYGVQLVRLADVETCSHRRILSRLNQEETSGKTALSRAVHLNSCNIARILVKAGARVIHSQHLVHAAVRNDNVEMVKILEDGGAILNLKDNNGHSPLMTACMGPHIKVIEYLLNRGIPANTVSHVTGLTAMHFLLSECTEVFPLEGLIDKLITNGADLNVSSYQGNLFLYSLICRNKLGAKLIIQYGYDVNRHQTPVGYTALYSAKRYGGLEMVKLVIAAGYNVYRHRTNLHEFHFQPQEEEVRKYIEEKMSSVPKLEEMCRCKIRTMYRGKNLFHVFDTLPLPRIIKKYLKLEIL